MINLELPDRAVYVVKPDLSDFSSVLNSYLQGVDYQIYPDQHTIAPKALAWWG